MIKSKRGFTILEVVSVATMTTIVAGLSLVSLQQNQIKSRQNEAKAELGALYQAQRTYMFKNLKQFNHGIDDIVFPEGPKRYNIGYKNHADRTNKQPHNYLEICHEPNQYDRDGDGTKDTFREQTCEMHPSVKDQVSRLEMPVEAKCPKEPPNDGRSYKAYAIGYIENGNLDPTSVLDTWTIDQNGALEPL